MTHGRGTLGGEKQAVQNPLIKYAIELGWQYISPDEALRLRGGAAGIILRELFVNQMQRLNPDFVDNIMAEDLINRLERIPPSIEGNFTSWEYLKGLKTVFVPYEKRERNVRFVDTENIDWALEYYQSIKVNYLTYTAAGGVIAIMPLWELAKAWATITSQEKSHWIHKYLSRRSGAVRVGSGDEPITVDTQEDLDRIREIYARNQADN